MIWLKFTHNSVAKLVVFLMITYQYYGKISILMFFKICTRGPYLCLITIVATHRLENSC